MAFDGTINCWVPDIPVSRDEKQRVRIAQFGDGYAQRTLDGINSLQTSWDVVFEKREKSIIVAMITYLANQKGNSFQFKEPVTGVMYDVNCDEWRVDWDVRRKGPSPVNPYFWGTLSATFTRAYGITV